MRTRNRNTQLSYPDSEMDYKSYSGATGSASLMNVAEKSETMTDRKTPGYFTAVKSGGVIPVSPMTRVIQDVVITNGTMEFVQTGKVYPNVGKTFKVNGNNCLFAPHENARFPMVSKPSVNKALLLQKALAAAQTDAWDTLTFAAEFHKTVDMLKTAKDRYARHWEKVYDVAAGRRKPSRVQSSQQEMFSLFSEVWLEYRFGLRPVIYDIQSIAETVDRMLNGIPLLARGHAEESAVNSNFSSTVINQLNGYRWFNGSQFVMGLVPGNGSTVCTFTRSIQVTGRASVGVTSWLRGLVTVDPLVTVWELTPWSVFLDYFVNVGELLAAFSPFAVGEMAFATYSETTLETRTSLGSWRAHSDANASAEIITSIPSSLVQTTESYVRTIESVSPDLSFSFNLNTQQVLDLLGVFGLMRIGQLKKLKRLAFRR